MIKKGVVKNVQANGTWQLKDGSKTFYKHEVSFLFVIFKVTHN